MNGRQSLAGYAENVLSPRLEGACALHGSRPHARARGADLRAAARGLGRQRHQDRAAGRLEGGDPIGGARQARDFQNLHRNKRSITLDLKSEDGRAAFLRLVETGRCRGREFPPGREEPARHRLRDLRGGQSAHRLCQHLRLTGRTAPIATRPGFDQIAQGMGGLMSVTGLPGQGPVRAGTAVADLAAGLFAALGILVALLERETVRRRPIGRDLAARSADFHARFPGRALADRRRGAAARPATTIRPAFRPASSRPRTATSTSRPPASRPGRGFARRSTAEHLIDEPDYKTTRHCGSKTATSSTPSIDAILAAETSADWIEQLNAAGVASGPIYAIDEMFADPQVQHLGVVTDIETPAIAARCR